MIKENTIGQILKNLEKNNISIVKFNRSFYIIRKRKNKITKGKRHENFWIY